MIKQETGKDSKERSETSPYLWGNSFNFRRKEERRTSIAKSTREPKIEKSASAITILAIPRGQKRLHEES